MPLFKFFKKSTGPYKNEAINLIYNLLFCDDLELYRKNTEQPYGYPFDVLFSEKSSVAELQQIIDDAGMEPRLKILAYHKLRAKNQSIKKELLAVIVEVGLEKGLDVLASFKNGTARYINQTGDVLVWEITSDETANKLTKDLFSISENIIEQIGPWDQPRRPYPTKGNMRISFLVSDEIYFGEGSIDVLFNQDPLSKPALVVATDLMLYLIRRRTESRKEQ